MEITKGKLKHLKSGKELTFACNPTQYELSQSYDFAQETQLAQAAPLVAFRCGSAAAFKFELTIDRDMGLGEDALKNASALLSEINKVDEEKASVSPLEFKMGSFTFQGYVRSFRWTISRFDPKGEPLAAKLAMELLSDGTYEKGGKA